MVTREVPGERTYQYFRNRFASDLSCELIAEKRALLNAVGHEIGRLHRSGICHGDLRVGNIIIDGKGSAARFFFIDNEKTRRYKTLRKRKRLKNLVQLNMVLLPQITKTDRLRFLNAYIEENVHLIPEKKDLIKSIYRTTQKRYQKKAQIGYKFRYSREAR
jgi:serine/threonine protein kinase